jgi:hypothetical protein
MRWSAQRRGCGTVSPFRTGSTTSSITVAPPNAGSFSCLNGRDLVLASVYCTDIVLAGSAGDTAGVPGTRCKTLVII